jgi:hypothetical protein
MTVRRTRNPKVLLAVVLLFSSPLRAIADDGGSHTVGGATAAAFKPPEPAPQTPASHESSARYQRTWGWIAILGGVAIGGAGTAFTLAGVSNLNAAEDELSIVNHRLENSLPPCDYRSGFDAGDGTSRACDEARRDAQADMDSAEQLRTVGYFGIGVGAVVAVAGLIALFTSNDSQQADHNRHQAFERSERPRFAVTDGPTPLGAGLRVGF